MSLRPYQQRAVDDLYNWFRENKSGNPCLVLPTGAGKSHIVSQICQDAVKTWAGTRVLMLTHQKELIEQNAEKLVAAWPNAPLGIYSASVGKRELGRPITFAGVQSVAKRAADIGHIDLVIIDECHRINHGEHGGYRALINELEGINPNLRVIGLTATPYRLGHGLITDKPAIFDVLLESVTIPELISEGFLSVLRSKSTEMSFDLSLVKKRGGEYVAGDLEKAINVQADNERIAVEIIARAEERKSWLLFCAGVAHAEEMAKELEKLDIKTACLTGKNTKAERKEIIEKFKRGEITALTNCDILTTGFDAPSIDLIAMLRPTMSPALYVQMAGRGLRISPNKKDCLVLDFAGNVSMHGPITDIIPPKKAGKGDGTAPVKTCPDCGEIVHASVMTCPACGLAFEREEKEVSIKPFDDDIMGYEEQAMQCTVWRWSVQNSRSSGIPMLACRYYGGLSDPAITEYLCILHGGYAQKKAVQLLATMAENTGLNLIDLPQDDLNRVAEIMNEATPPSEIIYKKEGRYFRVLKRDWSKSDD